MAQYVLLGQPVQHSVSPAMHNAAFVALGLLHQYSAIDTPTEQLSENLAKIKRKEWAGANITIPHKQAVFSLLENFTEIAIEAQAVNTIYWEGKRLVGHNTDVAGFLADLDAHGMGIHSAPVILFGAGGSARGVAVGLLKRHCEVRILARNLEKARQLATELEEVSNKYHSKIVFYESNPKNLKTACQNAVLAVNCTPLGMAKNRDASPWFPMVNFPMSLLAYDLVYNPADTLFVRQARAYGAKAVSGLGMLIHQGALAFQHWTGISPNLEIMHAAAQAGLELH